MGCCSLWWCADWVSRSTRECRVVAEAAGLGGDRQTVGGAAANCPSGTPSRSCAVDREPGLRGRRARPRRRRRRRARARRSRRCAGARGPSSERDGATGRARCRARCQRVRGRLRARQLELPARSGRVQRRVVEQHVEAARAPRRRRAGGGEGLDLGRATSCREETTTRGRRTRARRRRAPRVGQPALGQGAGPVRRTRPAARAVRAERRRAASRSRSASVRASTTTTSASAPAASAARRPGPSRSTWQDRDAARDQDARSGPIEHRGHRVTARRATR